MPAPNTRARSAALQAAARAFLEARGIDVTEAVTIRELAPTFAVAHGCHLTTAKAHLARAVRRMRYQASEDAAQWGGARPGAGRPRAPSNDHADLAAQPGRGTVRGGGGR